MGYFSNSTEGLMYQEDYCFKGADGNYCCNCVDNDDGLGMGCSVWDMHLWFNGNPDYANICNHLIPVEGWRNLKCIWHSKPLDLTQEEALNMSLDDWKQLERGDIDVQLRFSFMPDALVMLRHDGIPDPEEIRILRKPTTPTLSMCEPDCSR